MQVRLRMRGLGLGGLCDARVYGDGTDPPGVAILTVRSTSPGGVGGDAEDAGDVERLRDASGVSGVSGEVGGDGYARSGMGIGWDPARAGFAAGIAAAAGEAEVAGAVHLQHQFSCYSTEHPTGHMSETQTCCYLKYIP